MPLSVLVLRHSRVYLEFEPDPFQTAVQIE